MDMQSTPTTYQQLVFDDSLVTPQKKRKKARENHTLEKSFTELRALHERINAALYNTKVSDRPVIHSHTDVWSMLRPFLESLNHEELWIVLLDTKNRVLQLVKLYQGSLNASTVRVGEMFREAIVNSAASIIIVHNHPSGDPTASPEDTTVTRAAVSAGKLLDIDVLDHIIIGNDSFTSLKEKGLGFSMDMGDPGRLI